MIRERDCPRDWTPMDLHMGPAPDPDEDGNVVMERRWHCRVCDREEPMEETPLRESEVRDAVAAVRALDGITDLDERPKVLAEHGYVPGKRWWPPC